MASTVPQTAPSKFEDFDLDEVFQKATPHAAKLTSKNFVVEFGPQRARIAFDLDTADLEELLEGARNTRDYPIRWMYATTRGPLYHVAPVH
jgi:hypothetical protein